MRTKILAATALLFAVIAIVLAVFAIPVANTAAPTTHVVPCGSTDVANATGGACYLPEQVNGAPTLDTVKWGTDIPRCASDDWNSTGLARCYTESPSLVYIIDADDNTLATLAK